MDSSRKYVLTGVVVTAALVIVIVGWLLIRHFSYGKTWADYDELYHTDQGIAVFLDDSVTPYYGIYRGGQVYLPADAVKELLNDRFYVTAEGSLLYTLPDETVEATPEQRAWTIGGVTSRTEWPVCFTRQKTLYVAVDYAALFTDMRYFRYEGPDRLLLYSGGGEESWAQVRKKAQVRYLAGRKSLILTEVVPGDSVCVLEELDGWTKVRTENGFIGYMPSKTLGETVVREAETGYLAPDYTGTSLEGPVCLAWHQVFVQEANQSLTEFLEDTEGLTVIAPTWFSLADEEGGFTSLAEQWYVDEAHEKGLQVWALINDFDTGVDKYRLLSQTASRRKLIANLMDSAAEYGLDGINIDFEKIDQETGEHFIQFIRELSVECRKQGIVLSVDNYSLVGNRRWYNVREQGVVADYVIMMGYDEHWSGGDPGSTASITFTKQTIDLALKQVPAGKLIHGIPFYTRVWGEKAGNTVSSTAAGMLGAKELLEENGAELKWLEDEGQYFGEYLDGDVLYRVWLEDVNSLELKLKAIREAGAAGVACWKLGLEDPAVWPVIAKYLKELGAVGD